MDASTVAGVLTRLMDRLGYQRYGVHGYDTGSWVAVRMGRLAPRNVLGVHLNALLTFPVGEEGEMDGLTEVEQRRWRAMREFNDGYLQCNAKRPQTVGYALTDSPVGQLAWMVERFKELTAPQEEPPEASVDRDRMLTQVSLYWLTGTAASAAQIYYEEISANPWDDTTHADWDTTPTTGGPTAGGATAAEAGEDGTGGEGGWTSAPRGTVPTAVLVSSRDVTIRRWAERDHNVVRWTELDHGGHFLAMEAPEPLVHDIREFFGQPTRPPR